jgi:muconolactone delta-isomerase
MKFLIITRARGAAIPPQAMPALFEAMKGYVTRARNAGKWDVAYSHTRGGVVIANHDSHEDLNAWLAEMPMAPFVDIEVLPLADVDKSLDKLIETSRQRASMIETHQ